MTEEIKNYGLIIPPIETREQGAEHILGALEKPIINPTGNWLPYLPQKEPQNKKGVETFGCTIYGTLNALETLLKFKGYDVNYSDRYLALQGKRLGKINIPKDYGSDPHKVAELIRTATGCLREDRLPFADDIKSLDDYYNVSESILIDLFKEGQAWYKEWQFSHEWVFMGGKPNEKRLQLQRALERGAVCVSVLAWRFDGQKYYKPEGATDTHWTQLAYAPVDKYVNFDSYDAYLKDLDPLYDFNIAKVYYLTPISPEEIKKEKLGIIGKILEALAKILSLMKEQVKEFLIEDKDEKTDNILPEPQKPPETPINPQESTLNPYNYPYFNDLNRESIWFVPNPSIKWADYPTTLKLDLIKKTREICGEAKLTPNETQELVSTLQGESGFNVFCCNLKSKDFGVAQFSQRYYLKEYNMMIQTAFNNPETCIKIMARNWKTRKNNWVAFSSGGYLNWFSKSDSEIANFRPQWYSY